MSNPDNVPAAAAPSGDRSIIEQIASGDSRQVNDAFEALHAELHPYAAAIMRDRHVNSRDPVTVVDCVLMRAARRGAEVCADDGKLRGYLRKAVVNELGDERDRDRRRPRQMPGADETSARWGDPGTDSPGPRTRAIDDEDRSLEPARMDAFLAALESVPLSDRNRAILDLFVLRGASWEAVVNSLDLPSPEAGRKAMADMRKNLLPALMNPLRDDLPELDARVLVEFVVRRQAPATVAELLGIDENAVIDSFGFRIIPAYERRYGKAAVSALRRLMHKPRA